MERGTGDQMYPCQASAVTPSVFGRRRFVEVTSPERTRHCDLGNFFGHFSWAEKLVPKFLDASQASSPHCPPQGLNSQVKSG